LPEAELGYNDTSGKTMRRKALTEAVMPRFVGKRPHHFLWELLALIVLVLVILLVLELTGTTHIFT
jgi:hypothetical protein